MKESNDHEITPYRARYSVPVHNKSKYRALSCNDKDSQKCHQTNFDNGDNLKKLKMELNEEHERIMKSKQEDKMTETISVTDQGVQCNQQVNLLI